MFNLRYLNDNREPDSLLCKLSKANKVRPVSSTQNINLEHSIALSYLSWADSQLSCSVFECLPRSVTRCSKIKASESFPPKCLTIEQNLVKTSIPHKNGGETSSVKG